MSDSSPTVHLPENRQHKRRLAVILMTLAVDALGIGIVLPVLPDLLREVAPQPPEAGMPLIGLFVSLYAFAQFLFAPLLGALSDAWGRRPVLLATLFGTALSYALVATAPSLGWLVAGIFLSGSTAASTSAASAYVADVTPEAQRAARFGLVSGVLGFGMVAGPAFGGLLGMIAPRLPFVIAGSLAAVNAIAAMFVLNESLTKENRRSFDWHRANPLGSLKLLATDGVLRRLVYASALGMVAYGIFLACFVLLNEMRLGWGPRENGLALTGLGVGIIITQTWLLKMFVARCNEYRTAIIGYGLYTLAFIAYSLAVSPLIVAGAIALHALALISDSTLRALISLRAGNERQGEYLGAQNCMLGLAITASPLLGALLLHFSSRQEQSLYFQGIPFVIAVVVCLCAILILLRGSQADITLRNLYK
ncbi:MFS transporter [Photorhabdus laumondii]|uniref:Photorhabdus luminescens subsp. laumondii TTO1 complete genome segment 7/17 n=1 Tax=Photorhabdus laumondii subsp. laumondii (strain DSM 15139 / CIP 105565 / TT01) TaxID=243265 RepID=Q7N5R4_PHOLL|nr:MFS transporter [Photorhabdus laumondii]AXG47008.1 MFS transporter [Photorhabdus laumondii subsp. laumondii]CAE14172.1 unnamed protein product [Photorhabdus laumondii subsp. laumondii TTO1]